MRTQIDNVELNGVMRLQGASTLVVYVFMHDNFLGKVSGNQYVDCKVVQICGGHRTLYRHDVKRDRQSKQHRHGQRLLERGERRSRSSDIFPAAAAYNFPLNIYNSLVEELSSYGIYL